MEHFFKTVHITNFKSLKEVTLSDCKRINLLLGKPNVGKSNILEAIGLFSLPYVKYNESKKITQFIRLENVAQLFFDGEKYNNIEVTGNKNSVTIEYLKDYISFQILFNGSIFSLKLDPKLKLNFSKRQTSESNVKYFKFSENSSTKKSVQTELFNTLPLIPPSGINLIDSLEDKSLRDEFDKIFVEYKLKLVFDQSTESIKFMKELINGDIFLLPYNSIADTLQRIIFYKTAIASNENSILLFEDPEAHCFPPYIAHITQGIINSETNQFFIATHSPYVLDAFLEDARSELAIYMADFKEGQTVIKRLTDEEIEDVYNYGLDLFFNAELFTDEIQH